MGQGQSYVLRYKGKKIDKLLDASGHAHRPVTVTAVKFLQHQLRRPQGRDSAGPDSPLVVLLTCRGVLDEAFNFSVSLSAFIQRG